jgi:hypothetical protein
MAKKIKLVLTVHDPGRGKNIVKFTDDLCAVIEKHFPESGYTVFGGPETELKP